MNSSAVPAMDVFQKIEVVNQIAGNTRRGNWGDAQKQAHMTVVELRELVKSIEERDIKELRDVYCDLIVFATGGLFRLGADTHRDMHAVTDALLTRFDRTMEDALKTRKKYLDLGVETETRVTTIDGVTYHVTVSTKDQIDIHGEQYTAGKFLKSYQFSVATLQPLPEAAQQELEASAGVPLTHRYEIIAEKI